MRVWGFILCFGDSVFPCSKPRRSYLHLAVSAFLSLLCFPVHFLFLFPCQCLSRCAAAPCAEVAQAELRGNAELTSAGQCELNLSSFAHCIGIAEANERWPRSPVTRAWQGMDSSLQSWALAQLRPRWGA